MRSLNSLSQLTTVTRPSGTTEEKMLHHGHDRTPGGQACLDQWLWLTRCSSRCCRYRRSLHSRLNLKTSVRARRMCSLCRGPGGQLSSLKSACAHAEAAQIRTNPAVANFIFGLLGVRPMV